VGDAAGADLIFGEGISIALGYGVIAAREAGWANLFLYAGLLRKLSIRSSGAGSKSCYGEFSSMSSWQPLGSLF